MELGTLVYSTAIVCAWVFYILHVLYHICQMLFLLGAIVSSILQCPRYCGTAIHGLSPLLDTMVYSRPSSAAKARSQAIHAQPIPYISPSRPKRHFYPIIYQ